MNGSKMIQNAEVAFGKIAANVQWVWYLRTSFPLLNQYPHKHLPSEIQVKILKHRGLRTSLVQIDVGGTGNWFIKPWASGFYGNPHQ